MVLNSNDKCKTVWNIIKSESNRLPQNNTISNIIDNNIKLSKAQDIANTFKTYFLNVIEENMIDYNINQIAQIDAIELLKKAQLKQFCSFKLTPTTPSEIGNIIKRLKGKTSHGWDEISTKLLKSCAAEISVPISHVCYHSCENGIFPENLKRAIVKPLYKKGKRSIVSNY